MRPVFRAISPRSRKVLRFCAMSALMVLIVASLPFLFVILGREIDWIMALFPHSISLWKEPLWLR
jgi:hypothetical protein